MRSKIIFHYIIPEYFPDKGGIQQSLKRISESIEELYADSTKYIYVIDTKANDHDDIFYLNNNYEEITNSILSDSNTNRVIKNLNRVKFLLMFNKISAIIESNSVAKHIIISFYASHAGFYAQLIASYFNIVHITSVRGSDFYVNFLNHISFGSMEFVLKRADYIITTNKFQERLISSLYPNVISRICTIHNSVQIAPNEFLSSVNNSTQSIKLVADCGFSYKKGTEIILKSYEALILKGYKLELEIAGEIDSKTKEYWLNTISKYNNNKKIPNFKYLGFVENIQLFIQKGDIFLSASLSEGCSNSRILALCLGIPVVSTENGAIVDYRISHNNIRLVSPGNQEAFTSALEGLINTLQNSKENLISIDEINMRKSYFSLNREKKEWNVVLRKFLDCEN